jgi:hypothetical protein
MCQLKLRLSNRSKQHFGWPLTSRTPQALRSRDSRPPSCLVADISRDGAEIFLCWCGCWVSEGFGWICQVLLGRCSKQNLGSNCGSLCASVVWQ